MKMKNKLLLISLLFSVILISGCAKGRDDFGCWPPSCKMIPNEMGRQMCEDWKAGKNVTWYDCSYFADFPKCQKLCEFETKNKTVSAGNIPQQPSQGNYPSGFSQEDFLYHPRDPACAEDYYARVIYARPSDAKDKYEDFATKLKKWMRNANGILNTEAERFDMTADLKVFCENGQLVIENVDLPIKSSEKVSKQQVAKALRDKGFSKENERYIVFWDGGMYGCGGPDAICDGAVWVNEVYEGAQATREIITDDKLYEDSPFNKGGDFAFVVEDSMISTIILLHEYAHTMGAVALSAPNSAGEGHCKDEPPAKQGGNDIMCKSDVQGTVFENACDGGQYGFELRFDCNNDDYFNPKPEGGSYLATHWNIGSPLNRFIKFGNA